MAELEKPQAAIRYVDTLSAYDQWAQVYDTDGNFLQALDTLEMRALLPKAVSLIQSPRPWKLVDLGCGTGRNTVHLLDVADAEVLALDLSANMLSLAGTRLEEKASSLAVKPTFRLATFDLLAVTSPSEIPAHGDVDLVISTLVVEHTPLPAFLSAVSHMLKDGGLLLLTNMHSEVGNISQAGFVDPKTGDKIRPQSYPHTIDDIVKEAAKHGMQVAEPFKETAVGENDCETLGPRSRKWIGIKAWYGGILRKGN